MRDIKSVREEKAVSPVIGVILMVAITVILAAVIASFVFGLGSKVQKSAPQAQLVLTDAPAKLKNPTGLTAVFKISHNGGDPLICNDTKIMIYNAQTDKLYGTLTFNTSNSKFEYVNTSGVLLLSSSNVSEGIFAPGDIMTIYENASALKIPSGTVLLVKVIDTVSNKLVFSGTVQVW